MTKPPPLVRLLSRHSVFLAINGARSELHKETDINIQSCSSNTAPQADDAASAKRVPALQANNPFDSEGLANGTTGSTYHPHARCLANAVSETRHTRKDPESGSPHSDTRMLANAKQKQYGIEQHGAARGIDIGRPQGLRPRLFGMGS